MVRNKRYWLARLAFILHAVAVAPEGQDEWISRLHGAKEWERRYAR